MPMEQKQLHRSATNQVIAGICGGIGEYFDIDPTLVRIVFVILGFLSGSGLFLYLILWIIIPGPTTIATDSQTIMQENIQEMGQKIEGFAEKIEDKVSGQNTQQAGSHNTPPRSVPWLGIILIMLGGWFFLSNLGFLRTVRFDLFWPLILIVMGFYFLVGRR